VGLGLLAIEGVGDIHSVLIEQCGGGNRSQGDALVGRAVQHIKFDPGVHDGLGVKSTQPGQTGAAVEQPGIEKIGAGAPGFQGELAKAQHSGLQGEIDKLTLIILHDIIP